MCICDGILLHISYRPFIHSFIHSFTSSSIHSFIRSFVHVIYKRAYHCARPGVGTFFGEISMLLGEPRTASVFGRRHTDLSYLTHDVRLHLVLCVSHWLPACVLVCLRCAWCILSARHTCAHVGTYMRYHILLHPTYCVMHVVSYSIYRTLLYRTYMFVHTISYTLWHTYVLTCSNILRYTYLTMHVVSSIHACR